MNYLYLLLFLFLIYILILAYIKIKYKFWAYQPVFHYYNLYYWIYPIGIINKKLSEINKFCNFLNITTSSYQEKEENELNEITKFLRNHYYNNLNGKYLPTKEYITSYFEGNNKKNFISTYYKNSIIYNKKKENNNIPLKEKKLIATMMTRPLNLTFKKKNTFKIYYVDFLCVHKNHRKEGIAPEIIQTHEYRQCHENNQSQISLFKREGELLGIVPLTKYNTYQFDIKYIKKNENINSYMKLIEINKINLNLLVYFLQNNKNKFDCIILPDFSNLLNLIKKDTYKIYGIIDNKNLKAIYFFRNSYMYYDDEKNEKFDVKAIDLFASINNTDNIVFIKGFNEALSKYSKEVNAKLITIENISNNFILINYLFSLNIIPKLISPTAFFLYNYAQKPIYPENSFIIA